MTLEKLLPHLRHSGLIACAERPEKLHGLGVCEICAEGEYEVSVVLVDYCKIIVSSPGALKGWLTL